MRLPQRSTAAWRRKSAAYLEAHPLCERPTCKRLARHVDHIVARRLGGTDEDANLQAVCPQHHGQKTARERRADVFGFVYGTET